MTTTTDTPDAQRTYGKLMMKAQYSLTFLEGQLEQHERNFDRTDCRDWGYVGDLEAATQKLTEALAMLGDPTAQEELEKAGRY